MTDLVKTYGETRALDGLSLTLPSGGVHALLGPNGAGKTTGIRVLATLVRPDSGQARVLGHDVVLEAAAVRGSIALTGQFASLDEDLTARENLVLIGRLLGLGGSGARKRADELLGAFDLTDAAARQVKALSGGMRRRLDIASSLITRSGLLFLDEPTTGLDPRSRLHVWQMVRRLAAEGTTVILTTQYLDEADQLADRVAVIDHGRLIAEGTSSSLKAAVGSGRLTVRLADVSRRREAAQVLAMALGGGEGADGGGFQAVHRQLGADGQDTLVAQVPTDDRDEAGASGLTPAALNAVRALVAAGIEVSDFSLGQPTLDEVFHALTRSDGRDAVRAEGVRP
jgi:ABC-2 type transport system ATP-binding protein